MLEFTCRVPHMRCPMLLADKAKLDSRLARLPFLHVLHHPLNPSQARGRNSPGISFTGAMAVKRSKLEITKAVLRLAMEEQVRADELTRELFVSRETIRRWGNHGKNGVFLDTVLRADGILYSSRAALTRFTEGLKLKEATSA